MSSINFLSLCWRDVLLQEKIDRATSTQVTSLTIELSQVKGVSRVYNVYNTQTLKNLGALLFYIQCRCFLNCPWLKPSQVFILELFGLNTRLFL